MRTIRLTVAAGFLIWFAFGLGVWNAGFINLFSNRDDGIRFPNVLFRSDDLDAIRSKWNDFWEESEAPPVND
jgi:hypothetical protein